jgi:hypothetical protein
MGVVEGEALGFRLRSMSRIEGRLEELGLTLPEPMKPPGNFKLAQLHDGLCYVAGHTVIDARRFSCRVPSVATSSSKRATRRPG